MTFKQGHPNYRKPDKSRKETIKCLNCGNKFTTYKSNYRSFCSLVCRYQNQKGVYPDRLQPFKGHLKGERHPNWKGGKFIDTNGYVWVRLPDESYNSMSKPYAYEHRLLMEETLGRKLKAGEVIHHLNGNRSDNTLSNLTLVKDSRTHMKTYHEDNGKKTRFKRKYA